MAQRPLQLSQILLTNSLVAIEYISKPRHRIPTLGHTQQSKMKGGNGRVSVGGTKGKEDQEEDEEEEEREMQEFLGKLQISLKDLMGTFSKGKKQGWSKVYATLKPPTKLKMKILQVGHTLSGGVVDLDGNNLGDLLKHGEIHAFGWIYSFGDDGLYKKKDVSIKKGEEPGGEDKDEDNSVTLFVGSTTKTEKEFHGWLFENWEKYRASAYSLGDNNCLHFSKAALDFLEVVTPSSFQKILTWIKEKGRVFLNRMWAEARQQLPASSGPNGRVAGSTTKLITLSKVGSKVMSMKYEDTSLGSLSPRYAEPPLPRVKNS